MSVIDKHMVAVRDCLFGIENIERVLTTMMAVDRTHDALLSLACNMLQNELCLSWTEEGFVPFRQMPAHIIPYTTMSKQQLTCVLEALQHATGMQLTQTCPKSGTGLCVYVTSSTHAAVKAEPSHVLFAVVRVLRRTHVLHTLCIDTLCERVIDKLHGSVSIPRHRFEHAQALLRAADQAQTARGVSPVLPVPPVPPVPGGGETCVPTREENTQSVPFVVPTSAEHTHDVDVPGVVAEQQAQGVGALGQ